jgi:hypothetical protein
MERTKIIVEQSQIMQMASSGLWTLSRRTHGGAVKDAPGVDEERQRHARHRLILDQLQLGKKRADKGSLYRQYLCRKAAGQSRNSLERKRADSNSDKSSEDCTM